MLLAADGPVARRRRSWPAILSHIEADGGRQSSRAESSLGVGDPAGPYTSLIVGDPDAA
jgi:hypothetical protein